MADFERFVEVISKKESKRVVNITVRPIVTDCEGAVRFTDLMLQEGDMLSGYTPHTEICLKESENDPVWFNGIVRSEETVILLNLGDTSAGVDIHLYPKQDMEGGSVTLARESVARKPHSQTQCMPGTMWLFWRPRGNARGTAAQKRSTDSSNTARRGIPSTSCPCRRGNPRSFCIRCRK